MGQKEETKTTCQEKKDLYYVIKLSVCNKPMIYLNPSSNSYDMFYFKQESTDTMPKYLTEYLSVV